MFTIKISDMNLKQIAESGQCFRWRKLEDNRYCVVARGQYLEIIQKENQFQFSCDKSQFDTIWHDYFDLGIDYGQIKDLADQKDLHMREAVTYGYGIRILKQDLWEIIVSFMISQNNNIPRIRKSIELLCERYGSMEQTADQQIYYQFPSSAQLSVVTVEEYEGIGLGYRAKYIEKLVHFMNSQSGEEFIRHLHSADYETASAMLLSVYGIGKKVAECICLYGLHFINSFPVDTHVKKILDVHYPCGFDYRRYDGYLGIMQQYLFYYDLKKAD